MHTLGINAAYHDCSAVIVHDGIVLGAAEEERFTRIKHGKRPVPFSTWQLPFHAIDYCLREAGIGLTDVDHVAYAFDPWVMLDGTARVQTVAREQNLLLHDPLTAFCERTGVPVLVNTSFNTRGEPIVCTPRDAIESFCSTPLDALVIGSFLLTKGDIDG